MSGVDAVRLGRVLGMLGSAHHGEVVNAARLAVRIVKDAGMSWEELLGRGEVAVASAVSLHAENERLRRELAGLRQELASRSLSAHQVPAAGEQHERCLLWIDHLTEWERGFVWSLGRRRRWSTKQHRVLAEIAAKCERLARRPL